MVVWEEGRRSDGAWTHRVNDNCGVGGCDGAWTHIVVVWREGRRV